MKYENGQLIIQPQDHPPTVQRAIDAGHRVWREGNRDSDVFNAFSKAVGASVKLKAGFKVAGPPRNLQEGLGTVSPANYRMGLPNGQAALDLTPDELRAALEIYQATLLEAADKAAELEIDQVDALLRAIDAIRG